MPPLTLPGDPITSPDRPGGHKCPNCRRIYHKVKVKTENGKVYYCCPYCGYKLG